MSMDAPTVDVLRKQAIAMAMLWLTARDYQHEGGEAWFHVRARDLGLRDDVLPGKRIRVTIQAEPDTHGVVARAPEFDRDTDGELLIDWSPGAGRMLTLSLRADGRLSYAFTWDSEKAHGTAQMPRGVQEVDRG